MKTFLEALLPTAMYSSSTILLKYFLIVNRHVYYLDMLYLSLPDLQVDDRAKNVFTIKICGLTVKFAIKEIRNLG